MRHRKAGFKLGRDSEHRRAMRRNLAVALFTHGQITTTIPKAKSVKPFIEKLITAAKKGDLASRRRVIAALGGDRVIVTRDTDDNVTRSKTRPNRTGGYFGKVLNGPKLLAKLFDEIAPRYSDRPGGYTRIIKLSTHRQGDGADLCVLQLLVQDEAGPQVKGNLSRRRDKADKRMQFAAKLRKKDGDELIGEAATAVAEDEAPAEPEQEVPDQDAKAKQPEEADSNDDQKSTD